MSYVRVQWVPWYSLHYPVRTFLFQKEKDWRCSSVVRGLSSVHETLALVQDILSNNLNLHEDIFFRVSIMSC